MSSELNLSDLKIGDKVLIDSYTCQHIATVERLTKTQIVAGNIKYDRMTGKRIGGGKWNSSYLKKLTPEKVDELVFRKKLEKHIRMVREVNWDILPLNKLERILEIVNEQ